MLRVDNLCKQFGGIDAARDVCLRVEEHQLHAVIGPNGAGKTTLVAQLAGQLKPDRGAIYFRGRNITRARVCSRARLGLARSFQLTNVILPLSLMENAMLAALPALGSGFRFWSPLAGDTAAREAAMNALAEVGLRARAGLIAARASHGEQRRLEVALALAMRPKLLLLDEPFAGLGAAESAAMLALLQKLKRAFTIVLIEHDMDAVFALADVVSVLVRGRIIATGGVDAIRADAEVRRAYLGESL